MRPPFSDRSKHESFIIRKRRVINTIYARIRAGRLSSGCISSRTQDHRAIAPLRFSRRCSIPWRPQKTRKAYNSRPSSHQSVSKSLRGSRPCSIANEKGVPEKVMTYGVDYNGSEYRARDGRAVLGILDTADHLMMVLLVEPAED